MYILVFTDPLLLELHFTDPLLFGAAFEANQNFIINKLSLIETIISSIPQDIVYDDDSILHASDNNQLLSSCPPSAMLTYPSFINPTSVTTTV